MFPFADSYESVHNKISDFYIALVHVHLDFDRVLPIRIGRKSNPVLMLDDDSVINFENRGNLRHTLIVDLHLPGLLGEVLWLQKNLSGISPSHIYESEE